MEDPELLSYTPLGLLIERMFGSEYLPGPVTIGESRY